jgi:cytochrome b subunit of formate dehydrogenase
MQDGPDPMTPRHSAFVRVTHWISALSFLVLVLSGIAILLAHLPPWRASSTAARSRKSLR